MVGGSMAKASLAFGLGRGSGMTSATGFCAYVNPPGLQPNVVQMQAVSGMDDLEFNPFAHYLCSKVVLEPVTSEALDAFIDPTATWHLCLLVVLSDPSVLLQSAKRLFFSAMPSF